MRTITKDENENKTIVSYRMTNGLNVYHDSIFKRKMTKICFAFYDNDEIVATVESARNGNQFKKYPAKILTTEEFNNLHDDYGNDMKFNERAFNLFNLSIYSNDSNEE